MDVVTVTVTSAVAGGLAGLIVSQLSVWQRCRNSSSLLREGPKKTPDAEATGDDTEYGGTRLP